MDDDALTLAAAMSFYTALALAPLVLVVLAIAGLIWGQEAVGEQLVGQIDQIVGREGAELIETVIAKAAESRQSGWAAALGIGMLIVAATGLFAQLQDALNKVWDVRAKPGKGVWLFLRKRFLSMGMILVMGFLLLVSLVASTAIHWAGESIHADLPGAEALWQAATAAVTVAVFTLFFAAMFKYLPDAEVSWRVVWIGAFVTAILFAAGKELIGVYLGRGTVGSAYGAAGSMVVVLVWVYYSSLLIFFGAEFTQVYAAKSGHEIQPSSHAEREGERPRVA